MSCAGKERGKRGLYRKGKTKVGYLLGIDQSTQGTKAVLVDGSGRIAGRKDLPHDQIINGKGWVSHDPEQIWENAKAVLRSVIEHVGVPHGEIRALAITNQRETTLAWSRKTGKPLAHAIVWQCSRASELCAQIAKQHAGWEEKIYERTGIRLSPYFPASKMAWLLQNEPAVAEAAKNGDLAFGTIAAYLVYRLTGGKEFRTDYSNASRTQLFNLQTLSWDEEICSLFGIPVEALPEVTDSDGCYGETDLDGYLAAPVPIRGVLGDSHGALFGHNCRQSGGIKATYGTGSSIMLNIGDAFVRSSHGLTTSLGWKAGGKVAYVLEGNVNYSAAVISWLKNDVQLIGSPAETSRLSMEANPEDTTVLVPAFSGLGAPWWNNDARAMLCGMSRTTGKKEIVKAACESIAYQINAVVQAMREDTGLAIETLSVDGGATGNEFLMQFQSDLSAALIRIPDMQELSVLGPVYAAGLATGFYDERVFQALSYREYRPKMADEVRNRKLDSWNEAIEKLLR